MAFVVLEGFSGTGKTTLAKELEGAGWLRFTESAHAVPKTVPLAERADTFADYSLLGATMTYLSTLSRARDRRNIVAEGYLLSDLAYAKIRYEQGKSTAFPIMMAACKGILSNPALRPDLYIILESRTSTIEDRQQRKGERERNASKFFRERYYSALAEIHEELNERSVERFRNDSKKEAAFAELVDLLRRRKATLE